VALLGGWMVDSTDYICTDSPVVEWRQELITF
jgi:hypothetical protein